MESDVRARTAPAPASGSDLPAQAQQPILLFGMPRSGTTWLGKIFDSHPDTLYRHEPDSFGRLNFMPLAPDPAHAETWREPLERFLDEFPHVTDTKVAATLPQFPKAYLGSAALAWNAFAIRAAKLQARLGGEARARLVQPRPGRARMVWKSIESVARLGTISRLLPGTRGILLVRHPCGYVASVARGKRLRRFTDAESVGEDLGLLEQLCGTSTGEHYGVDPQRLRAMDPVERLAWQWVLTNDKALAETGTGGTIHVMTYEHLCADPPRAARELFEHAGLAMQAQSERFVAASTTRHRSRYYSVFKDPLRTAHAWRDELPGDVQRAVARVTAPSRAGALFEP